MAPTRRYAVPVRVLCAGLLAVLLGCSGQVGDVTGTSDVPASITVTPDSTRLIVGSTQQLTATVRSASGKALTVSNLTWSSDNAALASVSTGGLVTAVAVGGPVRVRATASGVAGSAIVVVGAQSTGIIDANGGVLAAPTSGATVTFSAGAVTGTLPVQVRDTTNVDARYDALGTGSVRMILPLTGTGNAFREGGTVDISLPIARALQVGDRGYVRARFKGVVGEYWAAATSVGNGRLSLSIPSGALAEFRTLLGLDELDATFDAEGFTPSLASTQSLQATSDPFHFRLAAMQEVCPAPPAGANPPEYAPCSSGTLTRHTAGTGGTNSSIGIVLVHGWDKGVANAEDYYKQQGMICTASLFQQVVRTCTWSIPAQPKSGRALPATAYFRTLIGALQGDLAGPLGGAPLYVFDYQSYRHYIESGSQLAKALEVELSTAGLDGFVLVAHSMGGLVSRSAARDLELSGKSQFIRGIITLGTPHTGTPLPEMYVGRVFGLQILTEGAQSLLPAALMPRTERAPMVAYSGNIAQYLLGRVAYSLTSLLLCNNNSANCDNDGVVPLRSAAPFGFAGIGLVQIRPTALDVDHSQLADLGGSSATAGLYADMRSNLQLLLLRAGTSGFTISNPPASVAAGATIPSIAVQIFDGKGNVITSPSRPVTIALTDNNSGAVLSGTKTAATDNRGIATFSGLSVDRVGVGYTLTATMAQLSRTTTSFDVAAVSGGTIVASPSSVSFVAEQNAALPASEAVAITSGGSSELASLALGTVSYGTGEPSGWLSVSALSGARTPASFTLRPTSTSLAVGTYHASIVVTAANGVSNATSPLPVTYTVSSTALLPAPTLLAPASNSTGVGLTPTFNWSAINGANRYWLMVATDPSVFPTDPAATSCSACTIAGFTTATSHTLPNAFPNGGSTVAALSSGTTYYWKVQAFNNATVPKTFGAYSSAFAFSTSAGASPSIALDRTQVQFTYATGGTLPALQTVDISNGGAGILNGLRIESIAYTPGQATGWLSAVLTTTTAPTAISFVALPSSLTVGSYSATVTVGSSAAGLVGGSKSIVVSLVVMAPTATPTPPSGLAATASANAVALTWSDNSSVETGFIVERAPGASTSFAELARPAANSTSYSDLSVSPATSYTYRVRAFNAIGASLPSNAVSVTTPGASCASPLVVTANVNTATTWPAGQAGCVSVLVKASVNVSAPLTIAAGATIAFQSGTGLTVTNGTLTAIGTAAAPIRFLGEQPSRGYWRGIDIWTASAANQLTYVEVAHGGGNSNGDVILSSGATLKLTNSTLRESATAGLWLHSTSEIPGFANNLLQNNSDAGVRLPDRLLGSLDLATDYVTGNGRAYLDIQPWGVSSAQTWSFTNVPLRFSGSSNISAPLVITPGVRLVFAAGAGFTITSGSLNAVGTAAAPIRFLGEQSSRGYWRGLDFWTSSAANQLTYVEVAYAGGNSNGNVAVASGASLKLTNSTLRESATAGLWLHSTSEIPGFANNLLQNNSDAGVRLPDRLLGSLDLATDYVTGNGRAYLDATPWGVGSAQTWSFTNVPLHFSGTSNITAPLVIAPGVRLVFAAGAGFTITSGSLNAVGTAVAPIRFLGEQPSRGYWRGLDFWTSSTANQLTYVEVAYAGGNSNGDVAVSSGASLKLTNSTLRESATAGLWLHSTSEIPGFANNLLQNNSDAGVRLPDRLLGSLDLATDYVTGNGRAYLDATPWGVGSAQTWSFTNVPVHFSGTSNITAPLVITPGVRLVFAAGAGFTITSGSLNAIGTAAAPIRFLGEQPSRGYWRGLDFWTASAANQLTYVEIAYGGGNSNANVSVSSGASLRLTNSTLRESAAWGLFAHATASVTPVPLSSGGNSFINNTLGNANIP